MRQTIEIRIERRWVRGLAVLGILAVLAPTAAWASDRFTDVPDSNIFHDDITALAEAGVTKGCNPPDNTEFCPGDNVTREQMAAFLNRLGALGEGTTPVVNAAALGGFGPENYAFAPEPIAVIDRTVDLELTGGAAFECVEATSLLFEPDFAVVHQLHATPAAIEPWQVNVQLDTRGKSEGTYDVCFATIDGSILPAGTYSTFATMTLP
jgi:hypothetical protein